LGATTAGWAYGCPAPFLESVDGGSYRRVGQSGQFNDLHDLDGLLMQPHDLLAPLVELLQGLVSCVFFFHYLLIRKFIRKFQTYLGRINRTANGGD
jgi:hypothetical protein